MSNNKKVVKSAICIIPPKELWDDIQEIRKENDKAYSRWPPHINLYDMILYIYIFQISNYIYLFIYKN